MGWPGNIKKWPKKRKNSKNMGGRVGLHALDGQIWLWGGFHGVQRVKEPEGELRTDPYTFRMDGNKMGGAGGG